MSCEHLRHGDLSSRHRVEGSSTKSCICSVHSKTCRAVVSREWALDLDLSLTWELWVCGCYAEEESGSLIGLAQSFFFGSMPRAASELPCRRVDVAVKSTFVHFCTIVWSSRLTIHVCLAKVENPRAASCPPRGASYRENVEAYRNNKLQRLGFYFSHLNEPGDSIS